MPTAGLERAASAGIDTALAALAFSVGPLIMGWAQNWSPPAVMAVAMTAYMVLTGALAVIYLLLLERTGISLPAIGWTLFAWNPATGIRRRLATDLATLPSGENDASMIFLDRKGRLVVPAVDGLRVLAQLGHSLPVN